MKYLILSAIFALAIISCGTAQKATPTPTVQSADNAKYMQGMQQAFGLWKQGKADEASALFERIGNVKQPEGEQEWLPEYYSAHVLISSSFATTDKNKRQQMLEKAKTLIAKAHENAPNNSEIHTLEGMLYTSYVALDPATYGMTLSAKIMGLHQKAVALDGKNPRALANLIEYEMGTAKFFGKDTAEYCEKMKTVLPLFDAKKYGFPFAPNWGKERAVAISKSCR